jgi:hypothetical protein
VLSFTPANALTVPCTFHHIRDYLKDEYSLVLLRTVLIEWATFQVSRACLDSPVLEPCTVVCFTVSRTPVPTFADRGVSRSQRGGSPTAIT